jgi:hypothetical protein
MLRVLAVATVLALAAPADAQAPAGWKLRLDRSTNASDPDNTPEVKFTQEGKGLRLVGGPAAVVWQPGSAASGRYSIKGRFRLNTPSGHNNYYGLIFGGADLDGPSQRYVYFLIGQNGTFIVKHRGGDAAVHDVQGRTPHEAIRKPEAGGSSTNELEVRVGADKIEYVINGTVAHTTPKTGYTEKTDGIWGVRINHQLDVTFDELSKK